MILVGTKVTGGADERVESTLTVKASTANKLVKALRDNRADRNAFSIRRDNEEIIAYAALEEGADHAAYAVYIDGQFVRNVPRKDVVGTVRLYADAQRLRGRLAKAPAMVVRPVAA